MMIHTRCAIGLAVALTASSPPPSIQQDARLPLAVEDARIVLDDPRHKSPGVHVTVRNSGPRAITAWALAGEVRFADGSTEPIGHSVDTFELGKEKFLHPSTTRMTRLGLQLPPKNDAAATEVIVSPSMVIFDDATAAGDERMIAYHFDRRERSRRVWQLLEAALGAEPARVADPDEARRAIEQEFEPALSDELRNTGAYHAARVNLRLALEPSTRLDARGVLSELLRMASARRAAGDEHATRR